MKPLEEFIVSVYQVNNSSKNVPVPLINILKSIITGEQKDKVNAIRRYATDGDLPAANALKATLPCFTVAGVFRGGHAARNLETPTELIILDFDYVADVEALRAICQADPHTVACFRSPKSGLKVIAHVENSTARHAEAYQLVRLHYEEITGLKTDESGKDLSRTCLMSYDPNAYIAALYQSFILLPPAAEEEEMVPGPANPTEPANASETNLPSFAGQEAAFVTYQLTAHPIVEGDRNQGVFRLACFACKSGCSAGEIYRILEKKLCDPTFSAAELKKAVDNGYQEVSKQKKLSVGAISASDESLIVSKSHMGARGNAEGEEEAYWQGEEYRKKTPFFPGSVFADMPSFLKDCMLPDVPPRERDVLFLSLLVSFSSLLPRTWGRYRSHRTTPHLFGWVVAPPASGKSIAQLAAKLLDVTDAAIAATSDREQKEYRKKKVEYTRAASSHNAAVTLPDEPLEPPYKMLRIPANISTSRLIHALHDNAEMGGIIFDTEAQTLANTNKQDFGQVDYILCQTAEQERVASGYLKDGLKPLVAFRPSMAMMLTSTTSQVAGLINNQESGLASRELFYTFRAAAKWEDIDDGAENVDDRFEELSVRAYALWQFCEKHPQEFGFSLKQWGELNRVFRNLMQEADIEGNEGVQPVLKRYGMRVMRIACILSRLEQFDGVEPGENGVCTDRCFRMAMDVVMCCYQHSRLLFTAMKPTAYYSLRNPNAMRDFFDRLPSRFVTAQALQVGEEFNISKAAVHRLLIKSNGVIINKIAHGSYEKTVA